MANAQQPTRRTRHVEMKYFACLTWVEDGFINYEQVPTATNYADSLSKTTAATKFHQHMDVLTGRGRPQYSIEVHPTVRRVWRINCFPACSKLFFPDDLALETFKIYNDTELYESDVGIYDS